MTKENKIILWSSVGLLAIVGFILGRNKYLDNKDDKKDGDLSISPDAKLDKIFKDNVGANETTTKTKIASDISTYQDNVKNIGSLSGFQNLYSGNKYIEGMQNLTQNLMISDINGMLSDSDTRILQANYSYIMWSVLAVGLLSITVNTINK